MKKSKFNLTHLHSATLDAGYLVPFLLQPTLPNDTFRIGLSTFLRAQPMLAPLMHEVFLNTQYWFVPYRLLWDSWEDFITGGSDLSSTPNFPVVTSTAEDAKVGSLWDYFGFPLEAGVEVSAMPFRALAEIWNTRYRDEDLQSEVPISYGSGLDRTTNRQLLSPCVSKDYFSVSRPFTQRGADIFVPITGGESEKRVIHKHVWKSRFFIFDFVMDAPTIHLGFSKENLLGAYVTCVNGAHSAALSFPRTLVTEDNYESLRAILAGNFGTTATVGSTVVTYDQSEFLDICNTLADSFVLGDKVRYSTKKLSSLEIKTAGNHGGATVNTFIFENVGVCAYNIALVSDSTVTETKANRWLDGDPSLHPRLAPRKCDLIMACRGVPCDNDPKARDYSRENYVTLPSTGQVSVRDLREASALQRYAERSLKYGNRYEEFIQREFGVSPRDSRIQRPEYLGGGRGLLNISEVLQTAESTDTGVGTMRGHGIGAITQRRIKFRSPEHGIIIGLLSIRPKIVYTQGVDREFLKRSRLDFFTPELANIGMQEVLTQEIYANAQNKGQIFGYSDRYQEYRYHRPLVTGEFRGNLNFWNMALEFANQPELNSEFVNMKTYADNWKRPFQIQDNSAHAFVCMLKNHIRAYRPIPRRAKDILK